MRAADLDGDGLAELVIAAPGANAQTGEVYLIRGAANLPPRVNLGDVATAGLGVVFHGESRAATGPASAWARAGESLAVLDFNGDGQMDLFVGSPRFEHRGVSDVGKGYVVHGDAFEPGARSLYEIEAGTLSGSIITSEVSEWLASTAAAPGDVNGDGHQDLLVSAPVRYRGFDAIAPGVDGEWSIYLVHGTGGAPGPLAIDGVRPGQVPLEGGSEVEVTGSGFDDRTEVRIGGRPAVVKRLVTTARMVVEAPPGDSLGFVDLAATRDAVSAVLPSGLRYVPRFYPDIDLTRLPPGRSLRVRQALAPFTLADFDGDGLVDMVSRRDRVSGLFILHGRAGVSGELVLPDPESGEEEPGVTFLRTGEESNPDGVSDVNGDGRPDLALISARTVTLLLGGERLPAEVNPADLVSAGRGTIIFHSSQIYPFVAGGADFDGDGLGDLVVREASINGVGGKVHLVRGRRDWPEEVFLEDFPAWTSDASGGDLGKGLALSPDLNGDGRSDLVMGVPGRYWRDDGHGYVAFGSPIPLEDSVEELFRLGFAARIDAFKPKDSIGTDAAALGDFNGDGFPDFALSAEGGGVEFAGESYVVFGGPHLVPDPTGTPLGARNLGAGGVRISGDHGYDHAIQLAPAGDFNGDGLRDLFVGATTPHRDRPKAYVVFGGPARTVSLGSLGGDGVRILRAATADPIAGGGDFNGDGIDDIAIGGGGFGPAAITIIFGERPAGRFLRGDSNGDAEINLSDALATLGSLFFGAGDLRCMDAADADDSGHLEITDVIFLLGALFMGSDPIPPPHPVCGMDPTQDGLDCRAGCVGG